MAQTHGYAPDGMVQKESSALDEELAKRLDSQLHEAAERVTFHRCELERWERIGRACSAGLREIHSANPVAQATPEDFAGGPALVPKVGY